MFCIEALGDKSIAANSYYTLVSRGDGPYTVGRHESNNIVIKSPEVSRDHATLEVMSFREFLNQCPGAYDNYYNSDRALERREYLEYRAKKLQDMEERRARRMAMLMESGGGATPNNANDNDRSGGVNEGADGYMNDANGGDDLDGPIEEDPIEALEAQAIEDEEEALMLSTVLCVKHYSKSGSTELRVSRPLDDLITVGEAKALEERKRAAREAMADEPNNDDYDDDGLNGTRARTGTLRPQQQQENKKKTPNERLAEGPLILRVSSVAFIPSRTDDAYALSFGTKAHFKVTFRPIVVAISQLHFSSEYVREMTLMYRQLGCTVLGDGNPTPNLQESSFQRELVTHVGLVGAVTIEELEAERILKNSHGTGSQRLSYSHAASGGPAGYSQNNSNTTPFGKNNSNASNNNSAMNATIDTLFTNPTRPEFYYNPLAKIHVCEEIDDSASVLNALTIGYTLALPVYIFELFAIVASDAARPLHTLPHPSKSVGGASAEPQKKREIYGSSVYCYPDSTTCPFSLYPIPQSSTALRSRVRLFKDRKFYLPNPMSVRRNQFPLAMGGCSRPLYMGMEQLPPNNNASVTAEKILQHQIEAKVGGTSSASPANNKDSALGDTATTAFSPLTAGSYVVVTAEMEAAVKELYFIAQAHYASYQRYPMAVLMAHPHVIYESTSTDGSGNGIAAANPVVFEELKAISGAVHRGYIPMTERSLHTALLTNKFIPDVVDEFVAWCVDEQRQVGLHLRGATAAIDGTAFSEAEVAQRRELLSVMFGEMLANDPAKVESLLEHHNDSLFQQLSADKAGRYAAVEDVVLAAGPANLGGGLLRHVKKRAAGEEDNGNNHGDGNGNNAIEAEGDDTDPNAFMRQGSKRANRRSLPLPATDFALPHHDKKQQHQHSDPYHQVDDMGRVRAIAVNPNDTSSVAAAGLMNNDNGADDDYDSDATPSDLDSQDHELNKVRVKGYHTQHLSVADDRAHFNRTMADAMAASKQCLGPEVQKIAALYGQVERNAIILAGGGPDAHSPNRMKEHYDSVVNGTAVGGGYNQSAASRHMLNNSIASTNFYSGNASMNASAAALRRPSANFPLARTTVTPHTITYINTLLQQHILPQLERLETCALTKEGGRSDHGTVQELWDEADGLREMCEGIVKNHGKECARLDERKTSSAMSGRYMGYAASELDSSNPNNAAANAANNNGGEERVVNPQLLQQQQQSRRGGRGGGSVVRRSGSPMARNASGVNTDFLRTNSAAKRSANNNNNNNNGSGPLRLDSSSVSSVAHGGSGVYAASVKVHPTGASVYGGNPNNTITTSGVRRSGVSGGAATPRRAKTPQAVDGRQQQFPFKSKAAAAAPSPYHHHSRLDASYVYGGSSSNASNSAAAAAGAAGGDPYASTTTTMYYAAADHENIAARTRDALSFASSTRNTSTPTRRTQTNSAALRNSADQRNARYAPLPLFAAQKVHKSQALQATTARVEVGAGQFFSDSDPTKIHLTGEERVDATLHEDVASFDTVGVARRRQLFAYRHGPEEGNKRFTLWLNSQTPKWTREFHRTLEMKNMKFADILDPKYAW